MRRLAPLVLSFLVAGCASGTQVTLLEDEDGSTGALAILSPDAQTEDGVLTTANTQATARRVFSARPVAAGRYDAFLAQLPPPPQVFVLYFIEGTTDLAPASVPVFEKLRQRVGPDSPVEIVGHTDTIGSAEGNDRLSFLRAREVRDALIARGLPVLNARVTGRGEREPRVPTADGVDEPLNRRVEVVVQ